MRKKRQYMKKNGGRQRQNIKKMRQKRKLNRRMINNEKIEYH